MKKILCAAIALMIAVVPAGCGKKKPKEEASAATNVTVYEAGKGNVDNTVSYTGTIAEGDCVSITAKVSAKVEAIYAEEGDFVQAGTVLAKLDATDLQLAYNQAKASYNSAVASYDMTANASTKQSETSANQRLTQAQIEYNDALASYNRQKELYDSDAAVVAAQNALTDAQNNYDRTKQLYEMGSATKVQLDSAETAVQNAKANLDSASSNKETALETARTRLENAQLSLNSAQENKDLQVGVVNQKTIASAKAGVDSAKAALDIAANNLKNTSIVSPISGYVSAKNIVKGQMASPGVEIFSVKNDKMVEAEINVTESDISFITVGSAAEVTVKAADAGTIVGTVTVANPTKDSKTGLYKVKVSVPNDDGKIKVGMIADIKLTLNTSENTITVPSEAVMQDGEEFYVYVASGDGTTASKAVVEKGIENAEKTEIVSGIKAGDKIIVKGKEYLSEKNNKIKITEE